MSEVKTFPDGVYTVLVTPFNDDYSINMPDLEKWVLRQLSSQVAGLVLLGTTSEAPNLSKSEQYEIVSFVSRLMKIHNSDKFLCVGVGGCNTEKARKFAIKCADLCDGFMVTVPCYVRPEQDGILAHFQHICNDPVVRTKPVIMYNVPTRTAKNMEPETVKQVCDTCANVKAIKEASGSMEQVNTIRSLVPELKVFAGDDKMVVDVMKAGGKGVISVASNVYPDMICLVYEKCVEDIDIGKEFYCYAKLDELCRALFCQSNPIPVKYFLFMQGLYKTCNMRLPMLPLHRDKRKLVDDIMAFYTV